MIPDVACYSCGLPCTGEAWHADWTETEPQPIHDHCREPLRD